MKLFFAEFVLCLAVMSLAGCNDNSADERVRDVLGIPSSQELTEQEVAAKIATLFPIGTPEPVIAQKLKELGIGRDALSGYSLIKQKSVPRPKWMSAPTLPSEGTMLGSVDTAEQLRAGKNRAARNDGGVGEYGLSDEQDVGVIRFEFDRTTSAVTKSLWTIVLYFDSAQRLNSVLVKRRLTGL